MISVFIGAMLLTGALSFGACTGLFIDHVLVYIKEEYSDKMWGDGFTVEDFKLENAEEIFYWDTDEIVVQLKKIGKQRVRQAVRQIKKLEFVKDARLSYMPHRPYYTDRIYIGNHEKNWLNVGGTGLAFVEYLNFIFGWDNVENFEEYVLYFSNTTSKDILLAIKQLNTQGFGASKIEIERKTGER